MDFWGAVGVLRRRWYVVVPAIVVAVGLALATFVGIPTRYNSTGVIVLTSPAMGGTFAESTRPEDVERINPLLAFDSSLTTAAQIIIQVLRDPATAEDMGADPDGDNTFEVNNGNVDQRGPFIVVLANGPDAEGTRDLVGRVLDRVGEELETRQRELDAPESTFITAQVLVQPTTPEAQIGGKIRFTGAAVLLGLFLALAAPFAVESMLQARRRRGDASGNPASAADPEPTPAPAEGAAATPVGPVPVGPGPPASAAGPAGPPSTPGIAAQPDAVPVTMHLPVQNGRGPSRPTPGPAARPSPHPKPGRSPIPRPSPSARPTVEPSTGSDSATVKVHAVHPSGSNGSSNGSNGHAPRQTDDADDAG